MRYEIKNGKVVESMHIDAPYDTREDAQAALKDNQSFTCPRCKYDGVKGKHDICVKCETYLNRGTLES